MQTWVLNFFYAEKETANNTNPFFNALIKKNTLRDQIKNEMTIQIFEDCTATCLSKEEHNY